MLISVAALKSALLCVADHRDIRSYLHDVYVTGNDVVSTNGHIAFIERLETPYIDEPCFSTRIPKAILASFLKTMGRGEQLVSLTLNDDMVTMKNDLTSVTFKLDAYYVNYNMAFADNIIKSATEEIKVNLDYFAILSKINNIVASKKSQPILNFNGVFGMITATWTHRPQYKFYVMPMR